MQLEPEGAHVVQFESRNNPRRCQSFIPRGGAMQFDCERTYTCDDNNYIQQRKCRVEVISVGLAHARSPNYNYNTHAKIPIVL